MTEVTPSRWKPAFGWSGLEGTHLPSMGSPHSAWDGHVLRAGDLPAASLQGLAGCFEMGVLLVPSMQGVPRGHESHTTFSRLL